MKTTTIIQGREITEEDLQFVQQFIKDNPTWHRKRLSIELAKLWDWKDHSGRLKDMACRTFMLKLHRQGNIVLPPPKRAPTQRKKYSEKIHHLTDPIVGSLNKVLPIQINTITAGEKSAQLFHHFLAEYHYLDFRGTVGKSIGYMAEDDHGHPLACLLFGAAAWQTASRDLFIGWDHETRARNLHLIAGNSRFLILPWVKVPHLASYLLGAISRRICRDWIKKYHHPVVLLETFVQKDRFMGTCYRAANWQHLGDTTGRTRNGQSRDPKAPIKAVYGYPLHKHFRKHLLSTET